MLHPDVPEELRGTYAGMAHPAIIEHLTNLGVTSVQLLPVHFHLDEPHLQDLGMTNYWGYNTAAFFALHPGYATRAARKAGPQAVQDEFKSMVKPSTPPGWKSFWTSSTTTRPRAAPTARP